MEDLEYAEKQIRRLWQEIQVLRMQLNRVTRERDALLEEKSKSEATIAAALERLENTGSK